MRLSTFDPYLYEQNNTLKTLLGIRSEEDLKYMETHGDPLVWTVGCIVMAMKRYEIKAVFSLT